MFKRFRNQFSQVKQNCMIIKNKRLAFTLAEVLITLGIIGVVAAMTIPTLSHRNRAKVLRTKLLQANSILAQGALLAKADDVEISTVINNQDYESFYKYFKGSMCTNVTNEKQAKYKSIQGAVAANAAESDLVAPFCMNNGMTMWFGIIRHSNGTCIIAIDINGWSVKPDTYAKDVFFWFYNTKSGTFVPFSDDNVDDFDIAEASRKWYPPCSKPAGCEGGITCTKEALTNVNYFNNLKGF